MSSYSRVTHTGKLLTGQMVLHFFVKEASWFSVGFFFPPRILQHPNILQCLGQCVEAIPILLVFEYCEMVSVQPQFELTELIVWTEPFRVWKACSALVFLLLWPDHLLTGMKLCFWVMYCSCEMFFCEQM